MNIEKQLLKKWRGILTKYTNLKNNNWIKVRKRGLTTITTDCSINKDFYLKEIKKQGARAELNDITGFKRKKDEYHSLQRKSEQIDSELDETYEELKELADPILKKYDISKNDLFYYF